MIEKVKNNYKKKSFRYSKNSPNYKRETSLTNVTSRKLGPYAYMRKKLLKSVKKKLRRRKKIRRGKLLTKRYKPNLFYGVIHLLCNKRSIFCTLSDASGIIKASVSTGMLKVKGKKRKSYYYVPKTGQLLINYMFKLPYRKYYVLIKGNAFRKKKRILIKTFLKIKKFKYIRVDNLAPRSHNGCRPPKIRRK